MEDSQHVTSPQDLQKPTSKILSLSKREKRLVMRAYESGFYDAVNADIRGNYQSAMQYRRRKYMSKF